MKHRKRGRLLRHICIPLCTAAASTAILWMAAGNEYREFTAGIDAAVQKGSPGHVDTVRADEDGTVTYAAEPAAGERYGWITSGDIDLQAYLYYGDSEEILEKGIGQYTGSSLPGGGGTILACGHDTTYCAGLEEAGAGDRIQIQTADGTFLYEVTETAVVKASDLSACRLDSEQEQLVLYTCYPFGKAKNKNTKRYFVYCTKISGPDS